MHKSIVPFVGGAAALAISVYTPANATPFTLEYSILDLGVDGYQYNFELILDNNDGSFEAGQQFDWLTFGNQVVEDGSSGAYGSWSWLTVPTGFVTTSTSGSRNGPTLQYGETLLLPGYSPPKSGKCLRGLE